MIDLEAVIARAENPDFCSDGEWGETAMVSMDDLGILVAIARERFELLSRIEALETNNARLTEVSMTRLRALRALNQPDPAPTVADQVKKP